MNPFFSTIPLVLSLAAPQEGQQPPPQQQPADPQQTAAQPQPLAPARPDGAGGAAVDSEALRKRIHDMRMNVLLGGDLVRQAETEAADFYSQKLELVEQRRDTVRAELTEKRASYELALDRALSAKGRQAAEATNEAARLRAQLAALEGESEDLVQKRGAITELVDSIQQRDRERQSLVAQLETSGSLDTGFNLPLMSIGLAPAGAPVGAASPYEDRQLMLDLIERDPRGARRILFEADPVRYWEVFTLKPQPDVVAMAIPFPPPDLPGRR